MKPMLLHTSTVEEAKELTATGKWYPEKKHDGLRAYIKDGKLYGRREDDITYKFPEFKGIEKIKGIVDGEIVATTGEFTDVSGRAHLKDKFKIKLVAQTNPAIFMAFDMPSDDLWETRITTLNEQEFPAWLKIVEVHSPEDFEEVWANIIEEAGEGVVIKKAGNTYREGKRSREWLKVKAFVEDVAEFHSYEVHSHGILLFTEKGQVGRKVNVNGAKAKVVRKLIDELGFVTAEIQHLPQPNKDAWRIPSFRGLVK